MTTAREDRQLNIVPVHQHIIAGLVQQLEIETGHQVLLTFEDNDNYDAFKLSDGKRKGPWCTIRPTDFELSTSSGGEGLST